MQDGSVQDIKMGHVENVSDEIVLSRITNIESCREKINLKRSQSLSCIASKRRSYEVEEESVETDETQRQRSGSARYLYANKA